MTYPTAMYTRTNSPSISFSHPVHIQTMLAGMDHFVGKPFNYVDLVAVWENHDREKAIISVV